GSFRDGSHRRPQPPGSCPREGDSAPPRGPTRGPSIRRPASVARRGDRRSRCLPLRTPARSSGPEGFAGLTTCRLLPFPRVPRPLIGVREFRRRMQFAKVGEVYDKIEATTKRLEMTDLLVRLLRLTPLEDLDKVVYLTQGRIHPDYMGIELGLAEKMVLRVVTHATGLDESKGNRMWKDKRDLGLVAEHAISARRQKPLESIPLTVAKVYENLDAIASVSGEGSQERKVRLLSDLLGNATPREAKYIVRMVVGKMRLGVADMTIVDALALTFATKADRDRVEQAYNVSSDLGEVARAISTKGLKGLDDIRLKLFRPIRAMLAER